MAIKREIGESPLEEFVSALEERERLKRESHGEFSEPGVNPGVEFVAWRRGEAAPTRPKLQDRITQLDRRIGSLQQEVGLQVKDLQDLTVQVAWLETRQQSLAGQVTDFIRKVKPDISVTQVAKASLHVSKRGIAVLSSFGIATLVGLAALLYGAFESIWAAIGGGLGLLALVLYEVVRLSKSKE